MDAKIYSRNLLGEMTRKMKRMSFEELKKWPLWKFEENCQKRTLEMFSDCEVLKKYGLSNPDTDYCDRGRLEDAIVEARRVMRQHMYIDKIAIVKFRPDSKRSACCRFGFHFEDYTTKTRNGDIIDEGKDGLPVVVAMVDY